MALYTAANRVLKVTGPEKRMLWINILISLQVIPALAALLSHAAVPGYIQCLPVAVTDIDIDIDQVLLKRIMAESVLDVKYTRLA
jgi:hypothetical protein